jgi:PilZ domain-containing protein
MLEVDNGQKLMEDLWVATSAKVELPDALKPAFFGAQGPEPLFHDNKRTYHRYFMRGKAVLKRGKSMFGTYTKDVSRQGVAFYSPVPLLPKERVNLRLATAELSLEVTRCRRIDPKCYECGAKFALQGRSSQ